MTSPSNDNQANIIEAFNSTSRYLDNLLNIDNPYFEGMVNQIYTPELQLNKANTSDTEAPFLDLHLSTRVVRKVRGHPLYNSTGTMNSFKMYINIFNNVSGINMRKIM